MMWATIEADDKNEEWWEDIVFTIITMYSHIIFILLLQA